MDTKLSEVLASMAAPVTNPAQNMFSALASAQGGRQSIVAADLGALAIGTEGFGADSDRVGSAIANLKSALASARQQARIKQTELSIGQEQAALTSALISAAPRQFVSRPLPDASKVSSVVGSATLVVGHESLPAVNRTVGVEAYDETANRSSMAFSVAYNQQVARQYLMGETFFPTIVVAPDSVGYNVSVRLLYTMADVLHDASGSLTNFSRKNIIRAIIDASILAVDSTRLTPVYRTGSVDSTAAFSTVVAASNYTNAEGQTFKTAPLAFGKKFNLLGLCQTDAQLAAGQFDNSDAVDSSVRLENLYLKITSGSTTEVFALPTIDLPTADFNAAPQGNTRLLQINFDSQALKLTASSLTTASAASTLLAALGTNKLIFGVTVNGSINQNTGDTQLMVGTPTLVAVVDANNNTITTPPAVATLVSEMTVDSFDLKAFRTNSNRRNRGKLMDIQHVNYLYTVPLLPPLAVIRPVTETEANDGQLVSDLVTLVRTQAANDAVTALLNAVSVLKAYADQPEVVSTQPKLFGISSMLVNPVYLAESIDVSTALDSLTSSDRAADLQALLINKIRDMATRAYVKSGYGPAAEQLYEGQPPKTVILIACDPKIYRYLTLTGDTRLVGDQFDYKVVESWDSRMSGKVIFSFGHNEALNSGVPDPLHFGNMAFRPELTVMLPMVRNGAQSMELTVHPSYRHVVNLPIAMELDITNIDTVIGGKVSLDVNNTVVP